MPTMSWFESAVCRSAPWRTMTRRVALPWAMRGHAPDGSVLEIGAGSGAMAEEILGVYERITMTVTDYDTAMVSAAQQRLRRFGQRAIVQQADANALPFGNNAFDTVLTFIMLHHTVTWEQVLSEAVRVLKPGGTLIGYDLVDSWAARTLHSLEGAPYRLLDRNELEPALRGVQLEQIQLKHNPMLVRFAGTKPR